MTRLKAACTAVATFVTADQAPVTTRHAVIAPTIARIPTATARNRVLWSAIQPNTPLTSDPMGRSTSPRCPTAANRSLPTVTTSGPNVLTMLRTAGNRSLVMTVHTVEMALRIGVQSNDLTNLRTAAMPAVIPEEILAPNEANAGEEKKFPSACAPVVAMPKKGLNTPAMAWVSPSEMLDRAPVKVWLCLSIMPPSAAVALVPFSNPEISSGSATDDCTLPVEIILIIWPVVTLYCAARIFNADGTPFCMSW